MFLSLLNMDVREMIDEGYDLIRDEQVQLDPLLPEEVEPVRERALLWGKFLKLGAYDAFEADGPQSKEAVFNAMVAPLVINGREVPIEPRHQQWLIDLGFQNAVFDTPEELEDAKRKVAEHFNDGLEFNFIRWAAYRDEMMMRNQYSDLLN